MRWPPHDWVPIHARSSWWDVDRGPAQWFHTGNYESEGHALTRATLPPQSERAGLQPCHQKPRPQDATAVPKAGVERNARNDSIVRFSRGQRGAPNIAALYPVCQTLTLYQILGTASTQNAVWI